MRSKIVADCICSRVQQGEMACLNLSVLAVVAQYENQVVV